MKKSLLLIAISFVTTFYGQSYKEPLDKLNIYLETFDCGSFGHIEVKQGDFCLINERGVYYKAKMEDINRAIQLNENIYNYTDVILKCKKNDFRFSIGNEKKSCFYTEKMYYPLHLTILLNDFIESYKNSNAINTGLETKFTGTLKDGKKSGQGQYYMANGTFIEGNFENDELIGKGKIFYINGDVYIGDIKNNKASGEGMLTYKTRGSYKTHGTYKGSFLNGLPNGKGKSNILSIDIDESNKNASYEGNWKDGLEDGFGIYEQININWRDSKEKTTYKGNWKNGLYEGYGVFKSNYSYHSGTYDGYWKNGMKDGQGVFTGIKNSFTNKFDGEWSKDERIKGKTYDFRGRLVYDGTEVARLQKERSERNNNSNEQTYTKSQSTTACICSKCNGSGTMRIKSIEVYYPDVVNSNGQVVGKSSYSKTIDKYEDLTCTKCLGTGKCN